MLKEKLNDCKFLRIDRRRCGLSVIRMRVNIGGHTVVFEAIKLLMLRGGWLQVELVVEEVLVLQLIVVGKTRS